MRNNFQVFITTYKRAESITTYNTLRESGYTGKIYLVVSDNDPELDLYKKNYDNILIFNKEQIWKEDNVDLCDNFENLNNGTLPRCFVLNYARKNDIKNVIILDDDITSIRYRYEYNGQLLSQVVTNLDLIFGEFVEYLNASDSLACLSFGNAGGYIGGLYGKFSKKFGRTVNQVYIIKVTDDIKFTGTRNCDDNFAGVLSINGKICMELYLICQYNPSRGSNIGGLHDSYKSNINIYSSNFYSIIQGPSYNKIGSNYAINKNYDNAYPMIVSSKYKKGSIVNER